MAFVKTIGLGGLNYLLGAAFGIIRGILICSLFIILVEMFHLDYTHSWRFSRLSSIIIPSVQLILKQLPSQQLLLDNFKMGLPVGVK